LIGTEEQSVEVSHPPSGSRDTISRTLLESAFAEGYVIMNKFEVLSAMGGAKSFKAGSESVEVDVLPCSVVPAVALLNIVAVVVAVDVEPNAVVILARNGDTVDVDRDLMIEAVVDRLYRAKPSVLSVPSGQEIGVNIKARCWRQPIIRRGGVLVGTNPMGCKGSLEFSSAG
jgi:hypothetical protein